MGAFRTPSAAMHIRLGNIVPLVHTHERHTSLRCAFNPVAVPGLREIMVFQLALYRARFFGHKFDLSGVLHVDFLPGETRLARAA